MDLDFVRIKCIESAHRRLESSTFVGQGGGRNRNMPKRPQSDDIDIDFARIKCIEIGHKAAECGHRRRLCPHRMHESCNQAASSGSGPEASKLHLEAGGSKMKLFIRN